MPDGTITFRTDLDNAKLEKDLAKVTKKIETIEGRLSRKTDAQSGIKLQLDEAKEAARQTENAIKSLEKENERLNAIIHNTDGAATDPEEFTASLERQKEITAQLKEQRKTLDAQDKAAERLGAKYTKATDDVNNITKELIKQKVEAENITKKINKCKSAAGKFGSSVNDIGTGFDKLHKRISKMISRVFLFSMLTSGLRAVRTWMGDVIKTNDEASAALARLKGALLTMAQPLVDVVIPAFTALVNVLAAVIGRIAAFFAYLGGKSTQEAADAAKALNDEKKALNGTGAAAKEASKSLAGFDEINKLSAENSAGGGGGSTAIETDFSWSDGISEEFQRIADYVLLIGAGLALWKIGSMLPGVLGTIATTLGGILVTVGGLLLMWNGMKDAWENGVDWGNMTQMIAGLAAAAIGLYIAFGSIGAGIGLVVGGIALLVSAFHDAMENGMNLQNTLLAIAGIFAVGLGISLLTGSWIPLLVAAIAAILLAITEATGHGGDMIAGLRMICQGFIDFFTGIFTGDWERAWEGIKSVATGAVNVLISVINSLISLVVAGLNMISFDVPEWVPGLGGQRVGFNIQNIPQIPYLAQGAVIPPNREFMAVLGDQKHGNNIEAPEDLIRRIVREETGGGDNEEVVALLRELIEVVLGIRVGDEVIGRAAARYNRKNCRATGV